MLRRYIEDFELICRSFKKFVNILTTLQVKTTRYLIEHVRRKTFSEETRYLVRTRYLLTIKMNYCVIYTITLLPFSIFVSNKN